MKPKTRNRLALGLAIAAVLLLALALYLFSGPKTAEPEPTPTPVLTPTPTPRAEPDPVPVTTPEPSQTVIPDEVDGLPVGKLVITPERKKYVDGSLTLYIPAINITRTIWNGTDSATLNKGVGLYDYAQLPGEGNRNVAVAGHRNGLDKNGRITDHAPFYYVDTLTDGDYFYLYNSQHIYRYIYEETQVVEEDDWSPIYTTGYSCLTITSCTPIGVSDHRIVVRSRLDAIFDYSKDFDYLASRPAEEDIP